MERDKCLLSVRTTPHIAPLRLLAFPLLHGPEPHRVAVRSGHCSSSVSFCVATNGFWGYGCPRQEKVKKSGEESEPGENTSQSVQPTTSVVEDPCAARRDVCVREMHVVH